MRQLRAENPIKPLGTTLTAHERKWIKEILRLPRVLGYRAYTNSPEFQAQLDEIYQSQEDARRAQCISQGIEYLPLPPFSAREKIKGEAWRNLPKDVKDHWREVARQMKASEELTE